MAKKRTLVKCGKKAFSFTDPFSKFNIVRGEVKELENSRQLKSGKIKAALRGGHLELATEDELLAFNKKLTEKPGEEKPEKDLTLREKLEDKTKAELVEYYEENFDVTEEDVEGFKKLKHPDMIEEILALDE